MNNSIIITERLGNILELQRGYDLPTSKRTDGEVPIISSSGYSGYHNEYKCEGENVVTGRYGTIGEVYYHSGKCWPLNTALFVKDFKGNIPKYVYYLLKNALSVYRVSGNDKSTVPGIDRKVIHEMPVPFHEDISYQQNICDILTCIDDKINTNSQICVSLESMAKTLYDYWFVQFDFPDENGRPYRASGGEMVWNEQLKREIPKGWGIATINEMTTSYRGVSYDKKDLLPNSELGVLVLRGNNIQNNRLIYDDNVAYIPRSFVSKDQKIRAHDIILTMSSGSKEHIGKCTMFQYDSPHTYGSFLTKFTPDSDKIYYVYLSMISIFFKKKVRTICSGTGINNLTSETFDNVTFPKPSSFVLSHFEKLVAPIFEKIGTCGQENEELTKLRDWLLPMLMNGQARVE